jgi:LmbE family N-acetylglucosaminyl deacetylase
MRIIYLSPHLDDAVLSAGGLIRAQVDSGVPVEIWTFMSGFPDGAELPEFARAMHRIWGYSNAAEAIETRRAEDLRAAAEVGARAVHFDFLDCIYRRGRHGEALYEDVILPIHPQDADLPAQVAQTMIAWLKPDDTVICQLAIGRHVDHIIVRKAAELLHRPLTYDADMPYVLNHPDELSPSIAGLDETLQRVSESSFRCWIAAIECYASQVDSVFGSHEAMNECMQIFWQNEGGIRLWTPPIRA